MDARNLILNVVHVQYVGNLIISPSVLVFRLECTFLSPILRIIMDFLQIYQAFIQVLDVATLSNDGPTHLRFLLSQLTMNRLVPFELFPFNTTSTRGWSFWSAVLWVYQIQKCLRWPYWAKRTASVSLRQPFTNFLGSARRTK